MYNIRLIVLPVDSSNCLKQNKQQIYQTYLIYSLGHRGRLYTGARGSNALSNKCLGPQIKILEIERAHFNRLPTNYKLTAVAEKSAEKGRRYEFHLFSLSVRAVYRHRMQSAETPPPQ